jgi:hypothetical protein
VMSPFRSRSQLKWMAAAEKRGEVKKGTFKRWLEETPDVSRLPEKVGDKQRGRRGRSRKSRGR